MRTDSQIPTREKEASPRKTVTPFTPGYSFLIGRPGDVIPTLIWFLYPAILRFVLFLKPWLTAVLEGLGVVY